MMKTFTVNRCRWVWLLLLWGLAVPVGARAEGDQMRETQEIIGLLKTRYVNRNQLNDKQLQEGSIAGILQVLGQGAQVLTPEEANSLLNQPAATNLVSGPLARAEVIDPHIGYLRIADVTDETVAAVDRELKKFAGAKVTGYVVDLRFADGTNYAVAAAIASRFVDDGVELFALVTAKDGPQAFRSGQDQGAMHVPTKLSEAPLMVLVNGQTRGSAEALAGALRAQQRCVVIGNRTAGSPAAWEDIKLSDGKLLRLATTKVVLPTDEEKPSLTVDLFPRGITPDIAVKIDAAVERDVLLNSATNLTLTASLEPRELKKGMSEAELVKAFRGEAIDSAPPAAPGAGEGKIQPVRDVVLQRAVDILKGIRVLLSWR